MLLLWISASSTSDFWTLNTFFIWNKGEVMLKYYATINKPHTHSLFSMWYIHQAEQHLHLVLLKALTRLSFIKQRLRGSCNKNTWIDLSACLPAFLRLTRYYWSQGYFVLSSLAPSMGCWLTQQMLCFGSWCAGYAVVCHRKLNWEQQFDSCNEFEL